MLTFYDAFHGVGGFRYGLEQASMKCAGGCEIDKFACKAYGVINNERCEPTDIRGVIPERLPDFDIFVGGFPCQDLSIAGNRKGFDGERSVLFFEILRICEVKRPAYILLENVTGLLSHNNGDTFRIVLKSLDELGYDAEWQIINSAAYVPQNRERIFIIGHLRGKRTRTVFPIGEDDEKTNELQGQSLCTNTITARYDGAQATGSYVVEGKQHAQGKINVIGKIEGNHDKNSRVYGINGIAPTLGTMQGGGQEPKIAVNCINPRKEDGSQTYQQDRVYDTNGVMTALTSELAGRFNIQQGYRIRKLTPLECFRLQSYPDWWYHKCKEAGISDSQLYKMAGNGVTSTVAYEIGKRMNCA